MDRRIALLGATLTASGLLVCGMASGASPLPKLTAAIVLGDRVTLTFSGALLRGAGGWTIVVNGAPVRPKAIAYGPKRLQLVLPRAVFGDDTVRVIGRNLRSGGGARLKLVDTIPVMKSPAGCTRELGTVAKGVAGEGPTDMDAFLRADRFRVLAVQVDYTDAQSAPLDSFPQLNTVNDWIRDLSYGRASVVGTRRPGVVRMPRNFDDYPRSGSWDVRKPFFQDLVRQIDAEIDFNEYDAILVRSSRKGSVLTVERDLVLDIAAGVGVMADGKELRQFVQDGAPTGLVRALVQLAGLPRLPGGYVGDWDPMGLGREEPGLLGLLAWHRRKLGWLDPSQVRCLGSEPIEVTLEPTWRPGGVKLIVVQTSKTTAIVLENRQRVGLDAGHCRKGILTYEIRTDWQYHLWVLTDDRTFDSKCEALALAPYDFRPKDSTRIRGAVTFEVLSVDADGSYRLRVTR